MHFVFEISGPVKFIPVYEKVGPIKRVQWLCFAAAFINMKYTDFLNILASEKN
jgi:hypothetical protein